MSSEVNYPCLIICRHILGIKMFQFYFKCMRFSAEPTRNFEPWCEEDEAAEKNEQKREAEEMGDAMKSLENRTLDSKRQMDIIAALDEMKPMKFRHATVSVDAMLEP
ncbi:hypothetical protein ACB092_02G112700 [Castanea dentata]